MSSDKPASDDAFGLQGWDTVNAISYAKMNRAIAKSGSTPKTFSFKDDTGWSIDGTWQPWDLTLGGSGQNLFLKCTIASGKLNSPFGKSLDLAGQWVVIEVFLNQVPADPSITDPTGKGGKGVSLVVSDQPPFADTKAVTISNSSIDEDTKLAIWKNDFDGTFRSYFNQPQTVKSFTQVFSTILLNSQADTGSFQWIKPTEASYAVGELERKYATLDNSVFAVLAQTEGRNTSKLGQQVDVRILDDLPKDTNSVFAISGARFIDQLVLPGAVGIMTGSKASDFSVDYKGLSVTNKKEVTWRKVTLDDSVGGYTVELKVPVNGFRMSLQGDIIELEFTGVWFDAPQWQLPGHLLVKTDFIQHLFLKAVQQKDGTVVLAPADFDPSTPNPPKGLNLKTYTVSIEPDQAAKNFENWMTGITLALAAVGIVAVAGKGISKAVSAAAQSAAASAEMSASLTAADVSAGMEDMYADAEALMNALDRANKLVPLAARANLFLNKVLLGTLLVGLPFTGITASKPIIEALTRDAIEDGSGLPAIDHFAANCLGASKWPNLKEWKLNNVRLNNCLLLLGDFVEAD